MNAIENKSALTITSQKILRITSSKIPLYLRKKIYIKNIQRKFVTTKFNETWIENVDTKINWLSAWNIKYTEFTLHYSLFAHSFICKRTIEQSIRSVVFKIHSSPFYTNKTTIYTWLYRKFILLCSSKMIYRVWILCDDIHNE